MNECKKEDDPGVVPHILESWLADIGVYEQASKTREQKFSDVMMGMPLKALIETAYADSSLDSGSSFDSSNVLYRIGDTNEMLTRKYDRNCMNTSFEIYESARTGIKGWPPKEYADTYERGSEMYQILTDLFISIVKPYAEAYIRLRGIMDDEDMLPLD